MGKDEDLPKIFSQMKETGGFIEAIHALIVYISPDPPSLVKVKPKFANVEQGDHLVYKTPFGLNVHFYVTAKLDDGRVEVYGRFCADSDDPFIEEKCLFGPEQADSLKIEKRILIIDNPERMRKQTHVTTDHIDKEKQRLEEYKVRKKLYGFLSNNSEHFVNFIKTGEYYCKLSQELTKALRKYLPIQFGIHGGWDALKAALKDGNWSALIVVLKKFGVLSAAKEGGAVAAIQTTESVVQAGTLQAAGTAAKTGAKTAATTGAKTGAKTVAKKAAKIAVKQGVKGTVVIQLALEGVVYTASLSRAVYDRMDGRMSNEEFVDFIIKQSTTSLGSAAGGIGGTLGGMAAGAAIGSLVPGIGTAIGAGVGGIIGGFGGGIGGSALGKVTGNAINYLRK